MAVASSFKTLISNRPIAGGFGPLKSTHLLGKIMSANDFVADDFVIQEALHEFRVLFTRETFQRYEDAIVYANANLGMLQKKGRAAVGVM